MSGSYRSRHRRIDLPRRVAYEVLEEINADGAYANLALNKRLSSSGLSGKDAAFVTELVAGTCRMQGTYDEIIEFVSGRDLYDLQPEVVDILRLACHQAFKMRTPSHATVATSVDLAGIVVGERVTGLVNAIVRKLCRVSFAEVVAEISQDFDDLDSLGFKHAHPRWIVDSLLSALGEEPDLEELENWLEADNEPTIPMLVARPGLCEREDLSGASPARYSPWAASRPGNPSELSLVRSGKAAVQDEGSQLVVLAASRAANASGVWLDMCSGPGGKSALLRGLAPKTLVSAELHEHRAGLVRSALRAYKDRWQVIVADGRYPAWKPAAFSLVLADVPCTGLGTLRRRPEARWRRTREDLAELAPLQKQLLETALSSVSPGGVVAYVTCSPHPQETVEIVRNLPEGYELLDAPDLLPEVPEAKSRLNSKCIQLFPHIHGTDAMFAALIRRLDEES